MATVNKHRRFHIRVLRGSDIRWNHPRIPFNPYVVISTSAGSQTSSFRTSVVFNSAGTPEWNHHADLVTAGEGPEAELEMQVWTMGWRGGEQLADAIIPLQFVIDRGVGIVIREVVPLTPFHGQRFITGSIICEFCCGASYVASNLRHTVQEDPSVNKQIADLLSLPKEKQLMKYTPLPRLIDNSTRAQRMCPYGSDNWGDDPESPLQSEAEGEQLTNRHREHEIDELDEIQSLMLPEYA